MLRTEWNTQALLSLQHSVLNTQHFNIACLVNFSFLTGGCKLSPVVLQGRGRILEKESS